MSLTVYGGYENGRMAFPAGCGVPRCERCGGILDKWGNLDKVVIDHPERILMDLSITLDGVTVASPRFREMVTAAAVTGLIFTDITQGYAVVRAARRITYDTVASGVRLSDLCPACGTYGAIEGAVPAHLVPPVDVRPSEFVWTDVEFGILHGQSSVIDARSPLFIGGDDVFKHLCMPHTTGATGVGVARVVEIPPQSSTEVGEHADAPLSIPPASANVVHDGISEGERWDIIREFFSKPASFRCERRGSGAGEMCFPISHELYEGADGAALDRMERQLGKVLTPSHLRFLEFSDGGAFFLHPNWTGTCTGFIFYPVETLAKMHQETIDAMRECALDSFDPADRDGAVERALILPWLDKLLIVGEELSSGNYLAVDYSRPGRGKDHPIVFIDHETLLWFGDPKDDTAVLGRTFDEVLLRAIRDPAHFLMHVLGGTATFTAEDSDVHWYPVEYLGGR